MSKIEKAYRIIGKTDSFDTNNLALARRVAVGDPRSRKSAMCHIQYLRHGIKKFQKEVDAREQDVYQEYELPTLEESKRA